jgi:geranylgeranyl diphosphate synthase, type I
MTSLLPDLGQRILIDFRNQVDEALLQFVKERKVHWIGTPFAPVLDALERFVLDGGKRIRPAMCHAGYLIGGGSDEVALVPAAASLELWHSFALIHDDIMDNSTTRRGTRTVHCGLMALHQLSGWRGDSDRFGVAAGIVAGDLCYAWSDELYATSMLPPFRLHAGRDVLARMRAETMVGQYLDLHGQAAGGTVEDALVTIALKAGRYTIERPLELGVVLAGGDAAMLDLCATLGGPLGEAFQLRDDLLGAFGDPTRTGKSTVEDLRDGKSTVLVACAREMASTAQLRRLNELLGNAKLDGSGVDTIRSILEDTGARRRVEDMIDEREAAVSAALHSSELTGERRDVIEELILRCTDRDH